MPRTSSLSLKFLGAAALWCFVGAGLAACSEGNGSPQAAAVVRPVKAQQVKFQDQAARLVLPGTVQPRIETQVGFRVAGKIAERLVNAGDAVRAGQVLARLDTEDLRLQTQTARARMIAAEADLVRAQADLDRYRQLTGSQVFTQATLDQRLAVANVARATLDQARGQLKIAENQLAYGVLTADTDGIVTMVAAEAGQVVAQGQTVLKLARLDELEVRVDVPENRVAELRRAEQISVALWTDDGNSLATRVREIAAAADPVTRTFEVRLSLLQPPPGLRLGMSATMTAQSGQSRPLAVLPLTAIYQQGSTPAVWRIDPSSGQISLSPVTLAAFHEHQALIADGVQDGDWVVTAGAHKLDADTKVRVIGGATQ